MNLSPYQYSLLILEEAARLDTAARQDMTEHALSYMTTIKELIICLEDVYKSGE